jgi:hypothetical protein
MFKKEKTIKKKSVIAIIVALVLMLSAATGWAFWGTGTNVLGSVQAAKFDVQYTHGNVVALPPMNGGSIITNGNRTFGFSINNMSPNDTASVNFTVKNIGTIPVKFEDATIIVPNSALREELRTTWQCWPMGVLSPLVKLYDLGLSMNANPFLHNYVIQPNGVLGFHLDIKMDADAGNNTIGANSGEIELVMNWKTINQP